MHRIMNHATTSPGRRLARSLAHKLWGVLLRLADVLRLLPRRLLRLAGHVEQGVLALGKRDFQRGLRLKVYRSVGGWWVEAVFYLLDCAGIGEVYESLADLLKFNTRPLYGWERKLARELFGDSLYLDRVRIDESAFAGPRQGRFCYVSCCTVNSWGPMQNSLLIHELVHVWQYQHLGLVYIPRALSAQHFGAGYDYGGVAKLRDYRQKGRRLLDFNYEQQADIVADYYRIKNGYRPRWGGGGLADLPVYEYFVEQLKVGRGER